MTTIIATVMPKGGVGKSATVQYVGQLLATADIPTLMIDADPQANLTDRMLGGEIATRTLSTVLDDGVPLTSCRTAINSYLSIIPADNSNQHTLEDTETGLVLDPLGMLILRNAIDDSGQVADVILIDCSPSLGTLTTAAMMAADYVLLPVQPEQSAVAALGRIKRKLEEMQRKVRKAPAVLGTVATMVEHNKMHREWLPMIDPEPIATIPKHKGIDQRHRLTEAYTPVAEYIIERLELTRGGRHE